MCPFRDRKRGGIIMLNFFLCSYFREAGVYGRAAGKDGTIPDICEPDAEFHIRFT